MDGAEGASTNAIGETTRSPQPGSADEADAAAERGLDLFRSGRRAEAIPHLERGAADGEPRAQYLLGVALHNGDHITADADRARSLLQAAAAAGIAQARQALDDMVRVSAVDPMALVSARAAELAATHVARIRPQPSPPTLESLAGALLIPLLRERLEEALPAAVGAAVDRALPAQPKPRRS